MVKEANHYYKIKVFDETGDENKCANVMENTINISPKETRCVCETQMPPIMANSNEGQDHKDKYFDTSRKILSQEMTMYNMEALVSYL